MRHTIQSTNMTLLGWAYGTTLLVCCTCTRHRTPAVVLFWLCWSDGIEKSRLGLKFVSSSYSSQLHPSDTHSPLAISSLLRSHQRPRLPPRTRARARSPSLLPSCSPLSLLLPPLLAGATSAALMLLCHCSRSNSQRQRTICKLCASRCANTLSEPLFAASAELPTSFPCKAIFTVQHDGQLHPSATQACSREN